MTKVSVIDYGMGNIKSVSNALKFLGVDVEVIDSGDLLDGEKIIIPGVGAFGDAMKNLGPFVPKIESAIESGVPILGICLGMQVLFETSEEFRQIEGLRALKGTVKKLETNLRLPHIGWNYLEIKNKNCPILDVPGGYVYYAHTYHARPEEDVVVAISDYGTDITAGIWKKNVYGTQFHPEKSGKLGLKILKNFVEL